MKKLTVLIATLLIVATVFGQAHPKLGIKAGLNVASLHTENAEADARLDLNAGLLAHIHLNHQFALQPELLYSGQGSKNGDFKYKLSYINIPVMIQYMFRNGFRLETGPQIGFLINAELDGPSGDSDLDDNFKKTDVAWGLGLQYLSKTGFGIGGRYNLGLSNINDLDETTKITNRVFQAGIFYMFDHAHKAKSK